jgi:hypothetical protein
LSNAPTLKIKPSESELKRKLNSSEERVRELEAQVNVLKRNISRLENEQVPLRELASDAQKEARRARDDRDAIKKTLNTSPTIQPSNLEFNKMKLDHATCRAELIDVKEELGALKDSQATLHLQLEEDQALILSKDRMISNLLSELEDASNKIEYSRAGGKIADSPNVYPSLSRMMGKKNRDEQKKSNAFDNSESDQMNSIMASQLKEAVLERERLKLKLQHELEKRVDLERKLKEKEIGSSSRNSDTEEEINSPRSRGGRRSPPSARVSNYRSDLKITELENELEKLRKQTRPTLNEEDLYSLENIHFQIEKELHVRQEIFSVSLLEQNFSKYLEKCRVNSIKLKEAMNELAVVEDERDKLKEQITNVISDQTTSRDAFDIKYCDLETEHKQLLRKLTEYEKNVSELQQIIDDQNFQLKKNETAKSKYSLAHESNLIQIKSEMKVELSNLKQVHIEEIENLNQKKDAELMLLQRKLDEEQASFQSRLCKEIELAKISSSEESNIQFKQQLLSNENIHKIEIKKILATCELEKSKLNSDFQHELIAARSRLEMAEQALVDSKQQYFLEREKLQEKIDLCQKEIEDLKLQSKSTFEEWSSKKAEFQVIIDRLNDDIDGFQTMISESNKKLESKSREVIEIQNLHEIELSSAKQGFQTQISGLEARVAELLGNENQNAQNLEHLKEARYEIEKLNLELQNQKLKTSKDIQKSQDALDDATDQLSRVQRVLKEVNSDVERYRKLAEERDNEVLNLKRSV